jgi:D-beta-D-heptose 7-phosphate kinase/D-beta-D-heptose 1-phosphate adenosyltransferase
VTPAGRVQRRDSGVGRGIGRRDRELSVVVVGDVVLDRDVVGSSDRLSPDTGAPVLAVETVSQTPGGAGLTALLCGEPGVRVTLVAPVATDPPGRALAAALHRRVDLVPLAHEGGTRVKARLFARDRAMLRLDTGGSGRPLGPTAAELAALRATLATADIVLVSDYGAGMTRHPDVRRLLAEAARQRTVVWDPHPRGGPPVPGVAVVTPNLAEARVAAGGAPGAAAAELGKQLRGLWQASAVCVTEGVDGVTLVTGDGVTAVPPPTAASGDPCGAGDRFAASVGLELAAGGEVGAAVARAVADAAAWVDGIGARFRHSYGDHGPVDLGGPDPGAVAAGETASPRRATAAPPQPAPAGPAEVAARVRAAGGTVVATGGVFDVLHAGHVGYLAAARALGDALVVLLNSDDSVRRVKGPARPVNPLADRRAVLSALSSVDAVGVFDEEDPRAALAGLRPDVWVKGGDYDPETMPETPDIRAWGGRVVVLPFLAGRSTTAILARLDADAGRAAPAGQRS